MSINTVFSAIVTSDAAKVAAGAAAGAAATVAVAAARPATKRVTAAVKARRDRKANERDYLAAVDAMWETLANEAADSAASVAAAEKMAAREDEDANIS